MAQNNTSQHSTTQEETEDALSFRNFAVNADGTDSINTSPKSTSSAQHLFEFFTGSPKYILRDQSEDETLNEYQKRDYLSLVRSNSFRRSPSNYNGGDVNHLPINYRSNSGRVEKYDGHTLPIDCSYHAQKVNISSITSMSAKSRRRMFMFGPVKFKPEMELSALKERQTRHVPTPMFPAVVEKVAGGRGKGGHHMEVVNSLRGRSHLNTVLARSFGCSCIPLNASQ